MKKIIFYLPGVLLVLLITVSSYKVLYVEKHIYKKYNGMKGKVVWATFNPRGGIYFCGIRLEDGTYDEVNWGSSPVKEGDTFINEIQYGFLGIVGTAYSVLPDNMPSMIWAIIWILFIFLSGIYLIYRFASLWVKIASEK